MRRAGVRAVEIVGPPGAGKTTLLRLLSERDPTIRAVTSFRRARYLPAFARSAVRALPVCVASYSRRLVGARELRLLVHLDALEHFVDGDGAGITVLDQGPVFMLSRLSAKGIELTGDRVIHAWWRRAIHRWRTALDMIVCLDAPDPVLLERIHARPKSHLVKDRGEREGIAFLGDFRAAQNRVIARLSRAAGPTARWFDTGSEPVDAIAGRVLRDLTAARRQPRRLREETSARWLP